MSLHKKMAEEQSQCQGFPTIQTNIHVGVQIAGIVIATLIFMFTTALALFFQIKYKPNKYMVVLHVVLAVCTIVLLIAGYAVSDKWLFLAGGVAFLVLNVCSALYFCKKNGIDVDEVIAEYLHQNKIYVDDKSERHELTKLYFKVCLGANLSEGEKNQLVQSAQFIMRKKLHWKTKIEMEKEISQQANQSNKVKKNEATEALTQMKQQLENNEELQKEALMNTKQEYAFKEEEIPIITEVLKNAIEKDLDDDDLKSIDNTISPLAIKINRADAEQKLLQAILNEVKDAEEDQEEFDIPNFFFKILFFCIYAPFAIINFLLNCLNIIQFLQLFCVSLSRQSLNGPILWIPNQINNWITTITTTPWFYGCFVFVILLQTVTDYQSEDGCDEETTELLFISKWITEKWDKWCCGNDDSKCKTCCCGYVSTQGTIHKLLTAVFSQLTNVASNILTGQATNVMQQISDDRDILPYSIVYVFFVVQAFDAKYFTLLVQTISFVFIQKSNAIKHQKKQITLGKNFILITYAFFAILNLLMEGSVQQMFFPFDFVAHIIGVFNQRVKKAIQMLEVKHTMIAFAQKQLILVLEILLLTTKISVLSTVLIVLCSLCLTFNCILAITSIIYKNQCNPFEISIDYIEPASLMEVNQDQSSIWQGYILNQKLTKYGSIPWIGSLLSCISSFLSSPPLAIDGKIDFGVDYVYNILNLATFFIFIIVYGMKPEWKWWIVFCVLCFIFMAVDNWCDAQDFLTSELEDVVVALKNKINSYIRRRKRQKLTQLNKLKSSILKTDIEFKNSSNTKTILQIATVQNGEQ